MNTYFVRAPVGLAALLVLATPAVAAPSSGGVRIIVQQWNAGSPSTQRDEVVLDRPGLLGDALNDGWAKARGPVCIALKAEAGRPNRLGPGFSLYNIDCQMAPSGVLSVTSASGNVVAISYRLSGNAFKATSTQPTAAGSYADPCASFTYDLSAKTSLHLDTLAVDTFAVSTENVSRPDSCNAAGDIAKFAAAALRFFGGPDFLAIAQDAMQQTQNVSTTKLNQAAASFVTPLKSYAGQYAVRQQWVRHGDLYFAFAPAYVPQPRIRTLTGGFRIEKTHWRSNAPDCSMFSVTGYVQTGPNPITDPERLTVGTAPGTEVGVSSTGGPPLVFTDRYLCNYTVRQLPSGAPITFLGKAVSPALSGHVQDKVGVTPEGWTGVATLNGDVVDKNFTATLAPEVVGLTEVAKVGSRVAPGDPAKNDTARGDPSAISNPASRVALNPQPLPPRVGDTLTQSGIAMFARGDFASASDAFSRAVAANPNNAVALHNLGLAHAQQGKVGLATSELRRAADLARTQNDFATVKASESAIIIVSGRH